MNHASEIFETNYNNYCRQIAGINFSLIKNTLGIEGDEDRLVIPFLNRDYRISKNGITDAFRGQTRLYHLCHSCQVCSTVPGSHSPECGMGIVQGFSKNIPFYQPELFW